jgi:hypothetical protein
MKTCKSCEIEKQESDFYTNNNKCKPCITARVRANRRDNLEYYTNYDKHRAMQPHRVAARHQYQQTDAGKAAVLRAKDKWLEINPTKRATHNLVNNAVKSGKLIKPENCEQCACFSQRLHGHHDDYSKPLDVRWLCALCHNAWHAANGEGANAA